jgi:methionyl-tRNA formyltransferase
MKFFILIHSVSSYVCLKKLIGKGYKPGVVITHEKYEKEKLAKDFYLPVQKLCKANKIKLIESDSPKEFISEVENYDAGICVGYMKILRKEFFDVAKYGVFNLHCGKLPEYRGRAPISRTIMNGDKELIATLHKMDEGVDSGPIAIETNIKITRKDDVNTLYKKFSERSYKSIVELLQKLGRGELKLKKQRNTSRKANTVLSEDECRIDWKRNSEVIFNKVRALKAPYPRAFTTLNGKKYYFNNAELTKLSHQNKAGLIQKVLRDNMYINTKDGILKISEVYTENKKITLSKAFKAGDKFL